MRCKPFHFSHRSGRFGEGSAAGRITLPALTLALVLGLVAACGSSGSSSSQNQTSSPPTGASSAAPSTEAPVGASLSKVTVGMTNAVGALPVLVAQQQKFFEKHGLEVAAQPVANLGLIPAALGKTYDVGITVAPILISAAASGLPLVAISGNEIDTKDIKELQVVASADIKTPKDLKGKRIATPTLQGNFNLATKHWLAQQGVDPSTVKFVQVANPNMVQQLKAGAVDAVEIQPPFTALALDAGFHSFGDPCLAITDPIQMTYYIASKNWLDSHQKEAKAYKAALDDAIEWITAHSDESYQIESQFTKLDLDAVKQIPLTVFSTEFSADGLQKWGDVMKEQGGFNKTVDYNAMVFSGT